MYDFSTLLWFTHEPRTSLHSTRKVCIPMDNAFHTCQVKLRTLLQRRAFSRKVASQHPLSTPFRGDTPNSCFKFFPVYLYTFSSNIFEIWMNKEEKNQGLLKFRNVFIRSRANTNFPLSNVVKTLITCKLLFFRLRVIAHTHKMAPDYVFRSFRSTQTATRSCKEGWITFEIDLNRLNERRLFGIVRQPTT